MITSSTLFDQNLYKRTGWKAQLTNYEFDNFKPRLIIRVATGRKYWPIISEVISPDMGELDPSLKLIEKQLYGYTHPMIDRFISELEVMLSDIYDIKIILTKPNG